MATRGEPVLDGTAAELLALTADLAVARAAELGRAGRLEAAADTLRQLGPAHQDSPVLLDLLARIRAQQGRFEEAEQAWQRVGTGGPEQPEIRAALRRLDQVRRQPGWFRRLPLIGAGLGLGLLVGLLVLAVVALGGRAEPGGQVAGQAALVEAVQGALQRDAELAPLGLEVSPSRAGVSLRGAVPSEELQARALAVAYEAAGAALVDASRLRTEP